MVHVWSKSASVAGAVSVVVTALAPGPLGGQAVAAAPPAIPSVPAVRACDRSVPAALAGADHILGARLAVWCDDAGAQTENQVAAGIRLPLRALAQKTWDPRRPTLSWADFTSLAT